MKHGRESFKFETLCVVPRNRLNDMECYWAEQLETYIWDNPGGYNMVWCGNIVLTFFLFLHYPHNLNIILQLDYVLVS
jgi:hypothetical protein